MFSQNKKHLNSSREIICKKSILDGSTYAIIDGLAVALPAPATHVCQDKRGSWFYCERRPRLKHDDWTPLKRPIQRSREDGTILAKVIQTKISGDWRNSIQTTIKRSV